MRNEILCFMAVKDEKMQDPIWFPWWHQMNWMYRPRFMYICGVDMVHNYAFVFRKKLNDTIMEISQYKFFSSANGFHWSL